MIAEVTDSYYNMKEKIEPCMYLIDTAKEAMTACGIEPEVVPIRGRAPTAPASPTWGSRARTSAPADITIMENMNLFRWIRFRRRRRYW